MKTKTILKYSGLAGLCFVLFCFTTDLSGQVKIQKNGDKLSWNGEYYDFRDSAGVKMIKLWVPPGVSPVRGVFISGHGGGSGDSRDFARDENIRAFAMRLGFAVAGLHNFPGRRAYNDGAPVFFRALDEFAKMGSHPELAHVPFVMYGSSNGGAATYGFVNFAPERAICFVSNVGAGNNPEIPAEAALKVPGIFIMGKFDALIRQQGIDRTQTLVKEARAKGALWTWALELKGHEDGVSFDVYMKLVEQTVKLRYPESENPATGAVKLLSIEEKDGWLTDLDSWENGFSYVDSYAAYTGDKTQAGWVLNADMAYVYRSMATWHNPLTIKVKEFDRTFNPHIDPGTMFSLGGPVTVPGKKITILCNTENFPGWKKIEFFNGSVKIGEAQEGKEGMITTVIDPKNKVYCLLAVAVDGQGNKRTSPPMHFFVKDPLISWKSVLPVPVYAGIARTGSGSAGKKSYTMESNINDSILVAYALTASQENEYSSADGKLSAFWNLMDDRKDRVGMSQKANGAAGSLFNPVLTHDCNMTVKAAYGSAGIYLLLLINDDNDVAWPNQLAGSENEQFYLDFDAADVLLDSRSVASISDPANRKLFLSSSFGLTSTTKQYQVACGTAKERPAGFKRAVPDPWDFYGRYFRFEEAKTQLGLEIEIIKTDYYMKAQEWFIPWSEYGGGHEKEPETGSRLAFTAGYNDRDEGEHFPPGVSSSGGSVKASNALRWIGKSDPWGSGQPPWGWGEIELGPGLVE